MCTCTLLLRVMGDVMSSGCNCHSRVTPFSLPLSLPLSLPPSLPPSLPLPSSLSLPPSLPPSLPLSLSSSSLSSVVGSASIILSVLLTGRLNTAEVRIQWVKDTGHICLRDTLLCPKYAFFTPKKRTPLCTGHYARPQMCPQ